MSFQYWYMRKNTPERKFPDQLLVGKIDDNIQVPQKYPTSQKVP